MRELREFAKPIIAMIHGFCMGGGVVMAMGADMRIGSDDSVYCIPVARLGVSLSDRGHRPARISSSGRPMPATCCSPPGMSMPTEAARIGLINRVVAKADLDSHVRALGKADRGERSAHRARVEDRGT